MSNVDFYILLDIIVGVYRYEVSRFGESIHNYLNQIKLVGRNKLQCGVNFDIHDSVKLMKDKCSKSLAKPQEQGSMITRT
jgi:hypothetical protein